MNTAGKNFTVMEAGPFAGLLEKGDSGPKGKLFVGQELGLTGCEVSLNRLPAGKGTPFVHAHKKK